jgi:hypothetical protein
MRRKALRPKGVARASKCDWEWPHFERLSGMALRAAGVIGDLAFFAIARVGETGAMKRTARTFMMTTADTAARGVRGRSGGM